MEKPELEPEVLGIGMSLGESAKKVVFGTGESSAFRSFCVGVIGVRVYDWLDYIGKKWQKESIQKEQRSVDKAKMAAPPQLVDSTMASSATVTSPDYQGAMETAQARQQNC